ncbi:hypothetical protein GOP47_0003270 [Adiantum capillus-veneris]|uniref:Uncharacterized protein n=1 Tax=Adiantum capillus-veneris TaxID=13818 RepID=A0A9D4ZS37_ADICA|nr:hypothetical protein GOP47_0003270 [Adiantum capillus-veneris]
MGLDAQLPVGKLLVVADTTIKAIVLKALQPLYNIHEDKATMEMDSVRSKTGREDFAGRTMEEEYNGNQLIKKIHLAES